MRCSVPDLCRVGQEIRRRTLSCSPRAEEGCADSGAVSEMRAGSFRSLTPLYRRYPLWPPPQLTPSAACCSFGGKQAPLSRTDTENRTWPRKRGCSPGSLLSCTAQGSLPSQAPVSRTNSRSRMWPGKRGCSPGSFLARAALPRSPLTTAPNAQCTNLSYAQCSAMLRTQPCPHQRIFSTNMGRTRYKSAAS